MPGMARPGNVSRCTVLPRVLSMARAMRARYRAGLALTCLVFRSSACDSRLVIGTLACTESSFSSETSKDGTAGMAKPLSIPWTSSFEGQFDDYSAVGDYCYSEGSARYDNDWIRAAGNFATVIDLDAAVRDSAQPDTLLSTCDTGDHLHPNPTGYQRMADAVDLTLFAQKRNWFRERDRHRPLVKPRGRAAATNDRSHGSMLPDGGVLDCTQRISIRPAIWDRLEPPTDSVASTPGVVHRVAVGSRPTGPLAFEYA